ncbi:MAG: hypothetical protein A3F13_08965 [Gammaproteobacteria bacterium RIFCSPHIGHO2_12_FULL_40_19]|nr:MAG: hypothetical protein A3F13_08965 [Gammaproteobacteria bacterium RIFCSPHIGHO2_12_FULL_40_19]
MRNGSSSNSVDETVNRSGEARIDVSPLQSPLSETSLIISPFQSETRETLSRCASSTPVLRNAVDHFIDFLSDALEKQSLIARWLYQLFLVLNYYHESPSKEDQETWLALPVIFSAALLSLFAKIIKRDSTNYIDAVFSSSFFYFACDVFFGADIVRKMPLVVFVLANLFCMPLAAMLFYELASPDHSHERVSFATEYPRYIVSLKEKLLNANTGMIHAATSLLAATWNIGREVNGKTMPLQWAEIGGVIVPGAVLGALVGSQLSNYPGIFQKFVMVAKFLKAVSLIFAAISAILFMANVYYCGNKTFCANESTRLSFTFGTLIPSLLLGLYRAMHTEFRFQDNHIANEKQIQKGNNAVTFISAHVQALVRKISDCCSKAGDQTVRNDDVSVVTP